MTTGRLRAPAALAGVGFGFWLAWTRMTDPDQILGALLLRRGYLWLLFATGVATAAIGLQALRRLDARTLAGRAGVSWPTVRPQRRHLVGGALFGIGWALAGVCPGPIAAQLGQGRWSALFTLAGLFGGIALADAVARRRPSPVWSPCGEAQEADVLATSGVAAQPTRSA
ncbi:MAG TPA: DUF6691 family protein [Polyangia bacterium]|nr:DUF6691 family protein [Polyangia bacterium]